MRIWDISPKKLCRNHLLGEHRELHAIWAILTENKIGYSAHPETIRWRGKLKALYLRHDKLVQDMNRRGYEHKTPLLKALAKGKCKQGEYVNSYKEQIEILKSKKCDCKIC
ncbi:MAG: pyrimidine dimer DNA glycosylase/endonuclease V [Candidatus Omnitrophica bacterium]|nr:pyrimidine dimer DNA glycosylase/endonuclease V [Candidatus Omnitrophota bacterium]